MKHYRKDIHHVMFNYRKLYNSKEPKDKKWAEIALDIRNKYAGTEYGELIRLKYDLKQTEQVIIERLNIERTTYYAWLNKIINEITLKAAYERLIIPY